MSDLNCCSFVGRLTRDAVVESIGAKGTQITKFAIANNTGFGSYQKTNFFNTNEPKIVMRREKSIPGYYCSGEVPDENGNIQVLYLKYDDSDVEGPKEMYFSLEEGYIYTTIQVGTILYEKPYFVRDNQGMQVIYPISSAERVFEDFNAVDSSYYFMLSSDSHAESYTAAQSILSDNGFNANNLQDIAEMEESERNIVSIIRVFSYGFIVLISLIAAANVFNTISTNIRWYDAKGLQ